MSDMIVGRVTFGPARDFASVVKDMTVNSVHTPTALGNEDGKRKAKDFKAMVAEATLTPDPAQVGKLVTEQQARAAARRLHPNPDGATAKSPFRYDPNALGSLRPDQVPRFFGALTDSDKLPAKTVKLDDLHAMQDRVDPVKVDALRGGAASGKLAVVVRHDGKDYIADGHHRLTADWLNGKDSADVRYKDLEPVDQALKRAPVTEPANFRIAKVDEHLGIVFGWAIVCKVKGEDYYDLNVDMAGQHAGERVPEHIPEAVMMKAAAEFMQTERPGNEMHEGPDLGQYVFAFPLTTDVAKAMGITTDKTGLMVGFKPPADVLAKYKSGEYTGFSIEGRRLSYTEHAA